MMQHNYGNDCQDENGIMEHTLFIIILFSALFLTGCRKDSASKNDLLSGTWVKGSNTSDTLEFLSRNDTTILRYRVSPAAYLEMEYRYTDGRLSVKQLWPGAQQFEPIKSFTWKRTGQEFEIQGIELFLFLSSTFVHFTYRKL